MKTCSIDGCEKKHQARGWCDKHYTRWLRHGSTDNPRPTIEERFYSKIRKSSDCWEWIASKSETGYGYFKEKGRNGRNRRAHRFMWELINGPIPLGAHVCHSCDNPGCVRPDHLWLGDAASNRADSIKKNRANMPKGENHYNTNLTNMDVLNIRKTYAMKINTRAELSRQYNMSLSNLRKIINGESWRHLPLAG